ncbi:MAG: DNA polymerase III subunit beta [Bacteroidota bacterium]
MKFTVARKDLHEALKTVAGAVPSKSTLPILECILFERAGEHLRLVATDLEISIQQDLDVTFESNGEAGVSRIAVPAKRLIDTLNALPDIPIEFTSKDEFQVELKTDQGRYKMVGQDGADYPAVPSFDEDRSLTIDADLLSKSIKKTGFAATKDALRPAMMGIYFQVGTENGRAVATDGHRLVRLTLDALRADEPFNFIVPVKALNLVGRVAGAGDCALHVGSSYVRFELGGTQVYARLIEEAYPNYESVIPVDNQNKMSINKASMENAVKRVSLYSSSMTHQIRLALRTDQVQISAEDIERASAANERVVCEYDGADMDIGFNSVYLTEVLSNIDSENVVFEFGSPNRAGIVIPSDQPEGEDMLMLIMPVMLNTYA